MEETEKTAASRLALSQSMQANVTENVKTLKAARAVTTKTVSEMVFSELSTFLFIICSLFPFFNSFIKNTRNRIVLTMPQSALTTMKAYDLWNDLGYCSLTAVSHLPSLNF